MCGGKLAFCCSTADYFFAEAAIKEGKEGGKEVEINQYIILWLKRTKDLQRLKGKKRECH